MKKIIFLALIFSAFGLFTKSVTAQKNKSTEVLISTKFGDMKVLLYNETPKHRDNFIKLINKKFYDGTIFHRVIKSFMIQGGDPNSVNAKPDAMLGNGGPGYTIDAEIVPKYFHKKGALAAARLGDRANPQKKSSGSQFYIVQGKIYGDKELDAMESRMGKTLSEEQRKAYKTIGGTPHLDGEYTVFGEVIQGLDIIEKIAAVEIDKATNRPLEDIKMTIKVVK